MRRLLCLVILLTGCAQSPVKTAWTANDQQWRQWAISGVRLTDKEGNTKAAVQAYVVRNLVEVKDRLEKVSPVRAELAIVETDSPNAFAVEKDGKRIVAFSISFLNELGQDKDALATTMGHEMAHLTLKHGEHRQGRDGARQATSFALGFFLGPLAEIGSHAAFNSFTREEEREADILGLKWAQEAGFDPCGQARVAAVFKRLGPVQIPFLSTHPGIEERTERASEASMKTKGRSC